MVRIGLWGTFDVEHLGDVLVPRVLRTELRRRLPEADLRVASPLGYVGLNRYPNDPPAAPLGAWSEDRVDELARELDLLLIGVGSIVHGDDARLAPWYGLPPSELERFAPSRFFIEGLGKHEVDVPTAWFGVQVEPSVPDGIKARWREALPGRASVDVRDEPSRAALRQAGVERSVDVVPDLAFLLPRILTTPALSARIDRLRSSGAFPGDDEALLVQGGAAELEHVEAFADAVAELAAARSLTPVLVASEPIRGDVAFADALASRLPSARRLSRDAGIDDVVAAVAWSAGVVGRSRSLHVVAASYDRPAVLVDLDDAPGLADLTARVGTPERRVTSIGSIRQAYDAVVQRGSIAALVESVAASVDGALDRVASLATDVEVRVDAPPVVQASSLADERERYAIATRSLAVRMAAAQAAFAERERDLRMYADAVNRELVERDIRFTKLWRRVHEGDRHYHFHKHRADDAELRIAHLEKEIEFLRGEKVRPWFRRRTRMFLWWLRPTKVGQVLVKVRSKVGGRP
jgi:polysaccharide pyruvyl transferase WcaK-like protein